MKQSPTYDDFGVPGDSPAGDANAASGSASFQAKWMRPGGAALIGLAVVLTLIYLLMSGHDPDTIAVRCSGTLVNVIVGWYGYRACWRSALIVDAHGLVVRNIITDIVVPCSQLDRVDVVPDDRVYLCTRDGQRIGVWALQTSKLSRLFGDPTGQVAQQIEASRLSAEEPVGVVHRQRELHELRPLGLVYLALCAVLAVTNLG